MVTVREDILCIMDRTLDGWPHDEEVSATTLAQATQRELPEPPKPLEPHLEWAFREHLKQMAGELLAARSGDGENLATVKPGEGPFERRMREFCNWQAKQPITKYVDEWRQRADAAGYADITLDQAAFWLRRAGREAMADGDALLRDARRREIGMSVIDGGKGGDDDAA